MDGLIFVYLIAIVWIILSIGAILEISKYPFNMRTRKLIWTNVVVLFPIGGLIVYYLYGKQNLNSQ